MNLEIATYLIYLTISIALTIWVAHTLHKNGRIFLVDPDPGARQIHGRILLRRERSAAGERAEQQGSRDRESTQALHGHSRVPII